MGTKRHGYHSKAPLLEDLVRELEMSEEEVIEEMRKNCFEPFHIAFGRNVGKVAFRKKRVRCNK